MGSKISGSSNLTGSFGKIDFRGTGEKVFLKYNHGSNANLNVGLKHFDNGSGGQFVIAGGNITGLPKKIRCRIKILVNLKT